MGHLQDKVKKKKSEMLSFTVLKLVEVKFLFMLNFYTVFHKHRHEPEKINWKKTTFK